MCWHTGKIISCRPAKFDPEAGLQVDGWHRADEEFDRPGSWVCGAGPGPVPGDLIQCRRRGSPGFGGRDFRLSIWRPAIYCAMVQSFVRTITRSKMTDLLAGRYRIDSPLGAGGMGEVFLAHDIRLERRVAIKWLHPDHEQDLVARERLRREALAAAALDHPFICKIHEIGDADGRTFIVMEYVEGETLQVAAGRELLPVRQIVDLATELAQALEEAHGRGVVHRDLKPSNVMVTRQGHVKVLDFGLAKQTVDATAQ